MKKTCFNFAVSSIMRPWISMNACKNLIVLVSRSEQDTVENRKRSRERGDSRLGWLRRPFLQDWSFLSRSAREAEKSEFSTRYPSSLVSDDLVNGVWVFGSGLALPTSKPKLVEDAHKFIGGVSKSSVCLCCMLNALFFAGQKSMIQYLWQPSVALATWLVMHVHLIMH